MTFPLASFTQADEGRIISPFEGLGSSLVEALRTRSQHQFEDQFPSLSYFHQLMEENATLYGENLEEAKIDFARSYVNELMPQLRESFELIVRDGTQKGIQWESIRFKRAAFVGENARRPGSSPFEVTFESEGREFSIRFERVLMNGKRWYIGHQASLL